MMKYTLADPVWLNEQGKRPYNEDFILPEEGASPNDRIFMVCDGVGGSAKGDVAARTACQEFAREMKEYLPALHPSDFSEKGHASVLNAILKKVEARMDEIVAENPAYRGMASTLTYLHLSDYGAIVAWAGDSRVYQFRNGAILKQTSDHSLVNELVKRGEITAEEARAHPRKNVILRAISGSENPTELEVQIWKDVQPGDYFLLCTDGILEGMDGEEIKHYLKGEESLETVRGIINGACARDSRDNYSMILIRVEDIEGEFLTAPRAAADTAMAGAASTATPGDAASRALPVTAPAEQQAGGISRGRLIMVGVVAGFAIIGLLAAILFLTGLWDPWKGQDKEREFRQKLESYQADLAAAPNLADSLSEVEKIIRFLKEEDGAPADSLNTMYAGLQMQISDEVKKLKGMVPPRVALIRGREADIRNYKKLGEAENQAKAELELNEHTEKLALLCKRINNGHDSCSIVAPQESLIRNPEDTGEFKEEVAESGFCGLDKTKAPWNRMDALPWCNEQFVVTARGGTFGIYGRDGNVVYPRNWFSEFTGAFQERYLIFKKAETAKYGIVRSSDPADIVQEFKFDSIDIHSCPDHVILIKGGKREVLDKDMRTVDPSVCDE